MFFGSLRRQLQAAICFSVAVFLLLFRLTFFLFDVNICL